MNDHILKEIGLIDCAIILNWLSVFSGPSWMKTKRYISQLISPLGLTVMIVVVAGVAGVTMAETAGDVAGMKEAGAVEVTMAETAGDVAGMKEAGAVEVTAAVIGTLRKEEVVARTKAAGVGVETAEEKREAPHGSHRSRPGDGETGSRRGRTAGSQDQGKTKMASPHFNPRLALGSMPRDLCIYSLTFEGNMWIEFDQNFR